MRTEKADDKINKRALFADETLDYRIPEEPEVGEWVTLRFRTKKDNVDRVYYVADEVKLPMEKPHPILCLIITKFE